MGTGSVHTALDLEEGLAYLGSRLDGSAAGGNASDRRP
jgi:hypothetical protein